MNGSMTLQVPYHSCLLYVVAICAACSKKVNVDGWPTICTAACNLTQELQPCIRCPFTLLLPQCRLCTRGHLCQEEGFRPFDAEKNSRRLSCCLHRCKLLHTNTLQLLLLSRLPVPVWASVAHEELFGSNVAIFSILLVRHEFSGMSVQT